MWHLCLSVFSKVNSRISPELLKKWTSTDLTFDLTFLSQEEKKKNNTVMEKRTSKNFSVFHLNLILPLCQQLKVKPLKLLCWITLCWKIVSFFKWKREKIKIICHNFPRRTDLALQDSGQSFKCGVQQAGSDVLTKQGQLKVFEVVSQLEFWIQEWNGLSVWCMM